MVVYAAGCNKKVHWCVTICAVNCTVAVTFVVRTPPALLFALQLFVDNHNFCLAHLHSMPPLGGSHRNTVVTFGTEKLEWCGYPLERNFWRYIYSFWHESTNVTDRQIDGWTGRQTPHDVIRRACIASHDKNAYKIYWFCYNFSKFALVQSSSSTRRAKVLPWSAKLTMPSTVITIFSPVTQSGNSWLVLIHSIHYAVMSQSRLKIRKPAYSQPVTKPGNSGKK